MAVAIVQNADVDPGGGTHTSITMAYSSTPTNGNLLIVAIGYSLFGEDRNVTPPGGWTSVATLEVDTVGLAIYRRQAGAGESNSYVFSVSGSADYISGMAYELSGHDTSNPINGSTTNSGSDGTYETGSVTPNVLSTQALAFFSSDEGDANSDTISSGWTYDGRVPVAFHAGGYGHRNSLTSDTTTAISATFTSRTSPWNAAILLIAPAAAGTTVTPSTASLTTTSYAPTVTASDHKVATPSTKSLVLSTFAPNVILGTVVTPGVLSLSTATFAPTVTASDHKIVTPNVLALSLTTFAPSVVVNNIVVPGLVQLTTSSFAPTVSLSDNQLTTPSTASLSLTAFEPAVSITDNKIATPDTLALSLVTFEPTVIANSSVVTPDTLALAITSYAPTVLTPVVATPDTLAVVLSGHAPQLQLSVIPQTQSLVLATFAPNVLTPVLVTPSTASLTTTPLAPVIAVGLEPGDGPTTGTWSPGSGVTGSVSVGTGVGSGSWIPGNMV